MKSLKTGLTHLLIIMALMLPWAVSEALETFHRAGVISKISDATFSIHEDQKYRIAPDVKIEIPGVVNAKFSDLKVGDNISFRGQTLSGASYVGSIVYYRLDNE